MHQQDWQERLNIAEVPGTERPSTVSRLSFLAIADIIEVNTPFDPREETFAVQSPMSSHRPPR